MEGDEVVVVVVVSRRSDEYAQQSKWLRREDGWMGMYKGWRAGGTEADAQENSGPERVERSRDKGR